MHVWNLPMVAVCGTRVVIEFSAIDSFEDDDTRLKPFMGREHTTITMKYVQLGENSGVCSRKNFRRSVPDSINITEIAVIRQI